jgi:ubiquinone/menaquinone biosynthesis C-methylase UbiE
VPAVAAFRKPYAGVQMEGPLARWYATTTGRDLTEFRSLARTIAERVPPGSAVLEVAPGPGYLAIELARLKPGAYTISGLDISRSFVQIAARNARRAGVDIDFRLGDVAHMPFASESFEFVVCRAAFKNFAEPVAALDEIYRVLRPGGQASIYDLRKDASPREIDREIERMRLSPINAMLTRWIFRVALLRAAYTRDKLETVVARSRFGRGDIVVDGIGFELQLSR